MSRFNGRTAPSLTFRAAASWAATVLAETLAPLTCAACDAGLDARSALCPPCARGVMRVMPPPPGAMLDRALSGIPSVVAFGVYGGPLADAVRRLKYGGRPELARPLGQLLRRAARDAKLRVDVVVPVPLHADRLVERGYNQAALLAREVADELDAPFAPRAIVRTRETRPQARLPRSERVVNVAGAIEPWRAAAVRGKRVALVDDVATTGATLRACALALFEAGATSVTGLVLARADEGGEIERPAQPTR
jgi:ComF family protein